MSLIINNTRISGGVKPKFNNVDLEKIVFNGVTVWEHDVSPHTVPDMSVCLTRTGGNARGWVDAADVKGESWESGPNYAYNSVSGVYWGQIAWTGGTVYCECSYTGTINKLNLPDGEYIKTLIVYRHGYGVQTIDVSEVDTVTVSDYDRGSNDMHPSETVIIVDATARATAGIYRIDYKYV